MLLSSQQLSALISSLGLSQSVFKPVPSAQKAQVGGSGGGQAPFLIEDPVLSHVHALDASSACAVDQYTLSNDTVPSFAPFDKSMATVYRYRQQQAVNLGSWFVHEDWMTPSLFACASGPQMAEIDIATGWGNSSNARAVLEKHWDTFINQSDFDYLASIGINTVRLPIGYWSLGPTYCQGTPFEPVANVYKNAWSRVVRAINMAAESGIGVLVDLHGAPGSQNGQAHSGISDGQTNLFTNGQYMEMTMGVLQFLAQELANVTNVVGLQILNEPQDCPQLSTFYTQAITMIRNMPGNAATLPLYIHDGFNLNQFSDFVSSRTDFVVEDHHSYFVFTPSDDSEPASQHTNDIKTDIAGQLASASAATHNGNLIIGEWSCALTPTSLANEPDQLVARQMFCQGQQQVYTNTTAGWSFWSYKTEDCDTNMDWCFKNAVGNTLPSSFYLYPNSTSLSQAIADLDQITPPSPVQILQSVPTQSPSAPPTRRGDRWQHRFNSIASRRRLRTRDNAPNTMSQLSIVKGYSDGFSTAKIFAKHGFSKLGFRGQYVTDSMSSLGNVTLDAGSYAEWFDKGLADGEGVVSALLL